MPRGGGAYHLHEVHLVWHTMQVRVANLGVATLFSNCCAENGLGKKNMHPCHENENWRDEDEEGLFASKLS